MRYVTGPSFCLGNYRLEFSLSLPIHSLVSWRVEPSGVRNPYITDLVGHLLKYKVIPFLKDVSYILSVGFADNSPILRYRIRSVFSFEA